MSSTHTNPIFVIVGTLGASIREWRLGLGLQQGELAAKAEIPQAALSDIERGKTKLPNADIRRRLAKALGVSHLDILIAAGEITTDEIAKAGMTGVVEEFTRSADEATALFVEAVKLLRKAMAPQLNEDLLRVVAEFSRDAAEQLVRPPT